MLKDTADLMEAAGLCDCSVREGYSGRGMYGKTTHGVVFESQSDAISTIAQVAFEAGELFRELESDPETLAGDYDPEEVLADFQKLSFDSMGLGIVVY